MLRFQALGVLALTVAIAGVAGGDARAGEVAGHVEPGLVVGVGSYRIGTRVTVGGDVTTWWSSTRWFDLGFESGLAVTRFPYSSSDGEPVIGGSGNDSSGVHDDVTLLPRVMFGARVRLLDDLSIGFLVGATHIVSDALGILSVLPYTTGSVAIEQRFGADSRYGVRAAFSYMSLIVFAGGPSFLTGTLAFTWGI